MYDENNDPTEALLADWNEHNDHAEDPDAVQDEEYDGPGAGEVAQAVIAAADCPEPRCRRERGRPCVTTVNTVSTLWPVPVHYTRDFPHPARYHAARQSCGSCCDNCWTTPDADGVSVQLGGADEMLAVLWSDTQTTAGTIRDLCARISRSADDPFDEPLTVDAVYLRRSRLLVKVDIRFTGAQDVVVVELGTASPWTPPVARASCPVPAGWLAKVERDMARPDRQ